MNSKRLIGLLRSSVGDPGEPTPFCPDDEIIAGFVDAGLDETTRQSVQQHLTECPSCVARVGRLTRILRESAGDSQIAHTNSARVLMAPLWAVAATVIAAIGIAGIYLQTPEVDQRDTRSSGTGFTAPTIDAPVGGLRIRTGSVIEWGPVPDSQFYDIRIVDSVGNIVSTHRVKTVYWEIDDLSGFERGDEYFIRIEARLPDNRSVVSDHVPFKVVSE